MSDTAVSAVNAVMTPSTPQFQALKDVLDRLNAEQLVLEKARMNVESLRQEAFALAKSIYQQKLTDDNYELAPTFCEGKSVEKVDSAVIKAQFPDIYEKCNPHIDNHGIAAILKKAHGDSNLQQMLRDLDPALWLEKSSITKADLKKHTTKAEQQAIEEAGGLVTEVKFDGEIKLLNKHVQDEYKRLHSPRADAEIDDDEYDAIQAEADGIAEEIAMSEEDDE